MKIRNGTTPIPMPAIVDDPRWIGRLSRDVRKAIAALRDRVPVAIGYSGNGGAAGQAAGVCSFGELYVDDGDTKIRGGWIACGDKNFRVAGNTINLTTSGDWLIQIELDGIDPVTDDDDEIFLPGVITASGTPSWEAKANTEGSTDYDDNTNPASPTGTGTAIVPIGRLVVEDGVATLSAVACGNVTISQCAGILSVTRG
jgi:hypothetical protein